MHKIICVIAVAILLSSCATIVSHGSSIVGVDTTPQGADVQIINRNGQIVYNGHTPATLSLRHASGFFKKASYRVKLSMEGYQSREVVIGANLNGWYFGNIVFGGVIGFLIIDPMSGAMYKLKNVYVDEKMIPQAAGTGPVASTLQIVALKDVPEEWKGNLERLP
jgi:hypothetical protein